MNPIISPYPYRGGGSHRGLCVCDAQRKSSHLQTCFGDNVGWEDGRFGIFFRNPKCSGVFVWRALPMWATVVPLCKFGKTVIGTMLALGGQGVTSNTVLPRG